MTKEQKIQEKIAINKGHTTNQVLLANRSMFEFIKIEIESGRRSTIRLPKWGSFGCKPERVKKLDEKGLLDTTLRDKPITNDKI